MPTTNSNVRYVGSINANKSNASFAKGGLVSFYLGIVLLAASASAVTPLVGVVEGFYWSAGDTVNGQSGQLSHAQRCQAVRIAAAAGAKVYLFAPHTGADSTVVPFTTASAASWRSLATLAHSVGLSFVYGLRPGWVDDNSKAAVVAKVSELKSVGVDLIALLFDDAAGANTTDQRAAQVSLVTTLSGGGPPSLWGLVPASYYGDPNIQASWLLPLAAALPVGASLILTGRSVTPDTVTLSDFPSLSRRIVFWDNWAAPDSSLRIPWSLGRATPLPQQLYSSSEYGYIAALTFPLERTVHQIARVGQLARAGAASTVVAGRTELATLSDASERWAAYLASSGFYVNATAIRTTQLSTVLSNLIATDSAWASLDTLVASYPLLKDVFVCNCSAGCANPLFCGASPSSPYQQSCACNATAISAYDCSVQEGTDADDGSGIVARPVHIVAQMAATLLVAVFLSA